MSNILDLPYSAGIISQAFWFSELRSVIRISLNGLSEDDIQKKCIDDNMFGMSNAYRTKRVYRYIIKRAAQLDESMMKMMVTSDLGTQKLINLIAVLRIDRLFFEFLNEVYREKVILGQAEITDADMKAFLSSKAAQSEAVAAFTDGTLRRIRTEYTVFMNEAGLISVQNRKRIITAPLIDYALEQKLLADGDESILKAITGRA